MNTADEQRSNDSPVHADALGRAQLLAELLIPTIGIAYALGLIVTNLWIGSFGIATIELFRIRYVLTGVLFSAFLAIALMLLVEVTRSSRDIFGAFSEIFFLMAVTSALAQIIFEHRVSDYAGVVFFGNYVESYPTMSHYMFGIGVLYGFNIVAVRGSLTSPSISSPRLPPMSLETMKAALRLVLWLFVFGISIDVFSDLYPYVSSEPYRLLSFSDPPPITWSAFFGVLLIFVACLTGLVWSYRRLSQRRLELITSDRDRLLTIGKDEVWAAFLVAEEKEVTGLGAWIRHRGSRVISVGALALLTPLFAFGVYPLLPPDVGGGRFERVQIVTTNSSLNSMLTKHGSSVYLLDVTTDSTLLVLRSKGKRTTLTIRASNRDVAAVVHRNP